MNDQPSMKRLGELVDLQMGGTPSRGEASFWAEGQSGNPWVAIGDLDSKYLRLTAETITPLGASSARLQTVPAGVPIMSFKLSIGKASIPKLPVYTNEAIVALSPKPGKADAAWLYHAIPPIAKNAITETAVKGQTLNLSKLRDLLIPTPEIPEQRRIAEILDSVDDQINVTIDFLEKSNLMASALADHLIPVRAEPCRLGPGWDLVILADVVPTAEYGISTPLESDGSGIPVLRMNNLFNGRVRLDKLKMSTQEVSSHLYLRDRDVLFNRTNSYEHVGRTAIWRDELDRATFASYLVRLNPDRTRLNPEYLVRWLNRPAIQQRIRRIATHAVHQVNINPTNLRKLSIELPTDIAQQQNIVSKLEESDQTRDRTLIALEKLRSVRRGLMDDLLTGRVRVPAGSARRAGG